MASVIVMMLVGIITGWMCKYLLGGFGFGFVVNILVATVGACIFGLLLAEIGLSTGNRMIDAAPHAIMGAVILLLVLKRVKVEQYN